MRYYKGPLHKALRQVFPNVYFDPTNFNKFSKYRVCGKKKECNTDFLLVNAEQRRNFLVEFARANEFDPLVAETWYRYTAADIRSTKVTTPPLLPSHPLLLLLLCIATIVPFAPSAKHIAKNGYTGGD